MITGLAIICVRNEQLHIAHCLQHMIGSGLDVYLIDNGSTDGTRDIASSFVGSGLIGIDDLPYHGAFSLTEQLQAKRRVIAKVKHDWIVHADADEWLMSSVPGQSLLDGLRVADEQKYNCVNFHECVFVPLEGEDFCGTDYPALMRHYYFFQPSYPRLNRAWRRDTGLDGSHTGGHRLRGDDLRMSPVDFILRHYIALSGDQARLKYIDRRFSAEDLGKGWHHNRVAVAPEKMQVGWAPHLRRLEDLLVGPFDLSAPVTTHFWQW